MRWDALLQATGRLSARSLREALPRRGGLSVLTWPADRPPSAAGRSPMREALSAGRRGFDDGRGRRAPTSRTRSVDEVLAPVRPRAARLARSRVPAVAAAARVAHRLPASGPAVWCTRGGAGGVSPRTSARLLDADAVVATMGDQRGLDEAINLGVGPAAARAAAPSRGPPAGGATACSHAGGPRRDRHECRRCPTDVLVARPRPARARRGRADPGAGGAGAARAGSTGGGRHRAAPCTTHCAATSSGPDRSSPCCRPGGVTDVLVNGADQVWVDRGDGLERAGVTLRRRRGRPPARPAAGRRRAVAGSTTPRRTSTCGCPTAPGSTPCWRRSPVPAPCCPCGCRGAGSSPRRSCVDAGAARALRGRGCCSRIVAAAAGVPGQRRHRVGQDHPAQRAARRWRPAASGSSSSRTPASCGPSTRTWSRSRRVRPTSRVRARSRCARWCGRRCGCGRTGSWSARSAGAEVVDLLAAMNTGHEGGCGTLHANSAADVPNRVAGLAMAAGLPGRRRTASSRPRSTSSCTCDRPRGGARRVRDDRRPRRCRGRGRRGARRSPSTLTSPSPTPGRGLARLEELLDR